MSRRSWRAPGQLPAVRAQWLRPLRQDLRADLVAVALLGLFASPISGASMNPARTLGPDIVSADFTGWWIYIAGPVIGAAIAVALIGAVRGLPDKAEREAAQRGALPILGSPKPPQAKETP